MALVKVLLFWSVLLPSLAQAATLTVDPAGCADYSSIGDAIAAASSGDTLALAAGDYVECLDTAGKSLSLVGAGEDTVISGPSCDYTLRVTNGESVSLTDLQLSGDGGGRGLYAAYSALSLTRVLASGLGNEGAYGGALEAYGSVIRLEDCEFSANTAAYGGALYVAWSSTIADQGSTYVGNTAVYDGGAVYTYAYDVSSFEQVEFDGNAAGGGGGAMLIAWDSAFSVVDSVFTDNQAGGSGGAAYLYALDPTASFSGTRFEGNRAGGSGGALELEWYTAISVDKSSFIGNTAASWGGAIFTYALDGFDATRSRFCGNEGSYGGAIGGQWAVADSYTNNIFAENAAIQGGALYRYASGAGEVRNNTMVGNSATDWGGAYFAGWYAYGSFTNNLVIGSTPSIGVYASDPYDYGNTTLSYDGWYDNGSQDAGGYYYVESGLNGHVLADPLFVAWSADGDCDDDDLRLATGSPMRDAGDPSISDPDGSISDIGALGGPDALVEDGDGDGFDTTSDCDDSNAEIWPDAPEICDGLDNDCDGTVDGADAGGVSTWYTDWDGDGYGDDGTQETACEAPADAVNQGGDCDDGNPYQSPGAEELCEDGFDQDCSGEDAVCQDSGQEEVQDTAGSDNKQGCGCASGGTNTGPAWILAGLVLGLGRRRRAGPRVG